MQIVSHISSLFYSPGFPAKLLELWNYSKLFLPQKCFWTSPPSLIGEEGKKGKRRRREEEDKKNAGTNFGFVPKIRTFYWQYKWNYFIIVLCSKESTNCHSPSSANISFCLILLYSIVLVVAFSSGKKKWKKISFVRERNLLLWSGACPWKTCSLLDILRKTLLGKMLLAASKAWDYREICPAL